MRLLHTADWHVGRTIRGRSRAAEFEAVLAELIEIARDEDVEAMLICGDIWDKATSTPDSDRLVFEALRECVGHGIQAVLLAGNHDSPRKLEALGLLSELLGIQTQHEVLRPNAGGVLTIEGREHVARIAAVPFITEGRYVSAAEVMGLQEDWFGAYADGVSGILRAICDGFGDEPTVNILATHIFVDGSRVARIDGSERLLHIGQTYGINAPQLPTTPQYIALGHVHEPQEILASQIPAAYSGSLLQLDFGERGQQKVVRIIDAVPGQPVTHKVVPLSKGRQLDELRGSLDEVLARGEEAGDAHLRVRLDVERPEPGIAERVREALPNAVDVQLEYEPAEDEGAVEALGQLSAAELFTRYYRAQHGAEPVPELIALFEELLGEVDDVQAAEAAGESPAGAAVPG